MNLLELLKEKRVIPITVLSKPADAVRAAEVLLKNSINILEITLRTENAFKCIKETSRQFPELTVGAGSVLSVDALKRAVDEGAGFAVAPGLDMETVDYALSSGIPFIPGIATPTELHAALKKGLKLIKVFPANHLGGPDYLKAIAAPFRTIDFYMIPTGGINEKNAAQYLKYERVAAFGASYISDSALIEKGDFAEIERRINIFKEIISGLSK